MKTPHQRRYSWQISIWKDAPRLYIIKEMQIKTTLRYHCPHIKMVKIWNTEDNKCCWDCGATGTHVHCWWVCEMVQPLWKTACQFLRKLNTILHIIQQSCSLVFTQKGTKNVCPHKILHIDVYSCFLHMEYWTMEY